MYQFGGGSPMSAADVEPVEKQQINRKVPTAFHRIGGGKAKKKPMRFGNPPKQQGLDFERFGK